MVALDDCRDYYSVVDRWNLLFLALDPAFMGDRVNIRSAARNVGALRNCVAL